MSDDDYLDDDGFEPRRAVVYLRVAEQGRQAALDDQFAVCAAYITAHDWDFDLDTDVIIDVGVPGVDTFPAARR